MVVGLSGAIATVLSIVLVLWTVGWSTANCQEHASLEHVNASCSYWYLWLIPVAVLTATVAILAALTRGPDHPGNHGTGQAGPVDRG